METLGIWNKCILGRGHSGANPKGCNLLGMFEKKAQGPSELGLWKWMESEKGKRQNAG